MKGIDLLRLVLLTASIGFPVGVMYVTDGFRTAGTLNIVCLLAIGFETALFIVELTKVFRRHKDPTLNNKEKQ